MHDNKVSEKAIWEGSITPDNDNPSFASQMQSQPQMMFCYKCNQVIPGNSTFCPYCQVKLFTECPKCGAKYSSQYPACSQCGTNREGYLRAQRQEQERKRVIEIENRRQREILEQRILEEERKKREAEEQKKQEARSQRFWAEEAVRRENEFIKATPEFKEAYAYLCELNQRKKEHEKRVNTTVFQRLTIFGVLWIIGLIFYNELPDVIAAIFMTIPIWCLFVIAIGTSRIKDMKSLQKHCPQTKSFNNMLTQEIVNKVSEYIATHNLDLNDSYHTFSEEHFIEEIIKAYKVAGGATTIK